MRGPSKPKKNSRFKFADEWITIYKEGPQYFDAEGNEITLSKLVEILDGDRNTITVEMVKKPDIVASG